MKPTAAPHRWPYRDHRTLAEVDRDEFLRRPSSEKRGDTLDAWVKRGKP